MQFYLKWCGMENNNSKIKIVIKNRLKKDDFDRLNGTSVMENFLRYKCYIYNEFGSAYSGEIDKGSSLYRDIIKWCEENCSDLYYIEDRDPPFILSYICFSSKNDVLKFNLHFS